MKAMMSERISGFSLPVALLSALCVPAPVLAQHSTPLAKAPANRVYPSGANISQKYMQPEANTASLMDFAAVPGHVSSAAAMSNLQSQTLTRSRSQKQLTP